MSNQTFGALKKTLTILLLVFFAVSMTAVAVSAIEYGPHGYPGDHHDNHFIWDNDHMWWRDGNNNWMWDGHYWWDNDNSWRWDGHNWWDNDGRRWDDGDDRWY